MFALLDGKFKILDPREIRYSFMQPRSRAAQIVQRIFHIAHRMFWNADYHNARWHLLGKATPFDIFQIQMNWLNHRGDIVLLKKVERIYREEFGVECHFETGSIRLDADRHGIRILFRRESAAKRFLKRTGIKVDFASAYEDVDHKLDVLESRRREIELLQEKLEGNPR
jgi:hypothetical protein